MYHAYQIHTEFTPHAHVPYHMRHSPLLLYHMLQPGRDMRSCQGWEPEACASGLQCGDDLGDVVADEAEARIAGVLLDDCKGLHQETRGKGGEHVDSG